MMMGLQSPKHQALLCDVRRVMDLKNLASIDEIHVHIVLLLVLYLLVDLFV